MKKILLVIIPAIILCGCGVKDPGYYDLKSPCVANEYAMKGNDSQNNPCVRTTPLLNEYFERLNG